jgi:hypothetical protein
MEAMLRKRGLGSMIAAHRAVQEQQYDHKESDHEGAKKIATKRICF